MSIRPHVILAVLTVMSPLLCSGESPPPEKPASDYLFGRELALADTVLDLTDEDWRLLDEKGRMSSVEAGFALYSQGYPAGVYHYILEFEVEDLSPKNEWFLLEMGPIYQADDTWINGHRVGSYGSFPAVFRVANRVQQISRRYVVPREWLNWQGPNELEVKVDTGVIGGTIEYGGGGIFQGPVTLTPLRQGVLVDFALRDPSLPSISPLLSDAAHLNQFLESENLNLRLRLAQLSPTAEIADLEVEVALSGHGSTAERRIVNLGAGEWSRWESIRLPMPRAGSHDCEVTVRSGEKILYQNKISFRVKEKLPELSVSGVLEVADLPDSLVWQDVSSRTVGSFGARANDEEGVLDPYSWDQDVRGTLTTVVHARRDSSRPLLLFTGVQEPPLTPLDAADYQEFPLGREYDGFGDAWPFGFVRMGSARTGSSSLECANWVSRRYQFRGDGDEELGEMTISKLSPAFRLDVKAESVGFFDDMEQWGLDGPSQMAFAGQEGVRVVPQGDGFAGADMAENWILVWFHGSRGWEDFDIPWLFVCERAPGKVSLSSEGVVLGSNDGGSVGVLYGMPLYGVRLLEPGTTEEWQNGPGEGALEDLRRWSRTLAAYPVGLDREVAVDWEAGDAYVRERVRLLSSPVSDFPQAEEMTPVPPVMALGMHSENLKIEVSEDLEDYRLVTIFGPFLANAGANQLIYRIPDLLRFVSEAPLPKDDAPASENYNETRRILQGALEELVAESRLDQHPWPRSIWRGKFTPGYAQFEYSSMLASLPYLEEPFRESFKRILLNEVDNVFLARELGSEARAVGGWNPEPGADLYQDIFEPMTGQTLTVLGDHLDRRAIDVPFWQSFQIYTIWQAAQYLGNWNKTREEWAHVSGLAELPLHSHDWSTLQSWDFFSGYRIGNGIQESGGMYAGYVAMARMAHHFGYEDERDLRAGLAVLQLIGMNAANIGIDYMRFHRPWSGRNSTAREIARAEKMFPTRYIEYNEFTGSPVQAILLPWWPFFYTSYIHDLLPDVMRVYPEIWPEENAAFFRRASFEPPLDMAIRMERADESRIEAIYRRQVRSPKLYERIMAARGYLEFAGAMEWEEVISSRENSEKDMKNEKPK